MTADTAAVATPARRSKIVSILRLVLINFLVFAVFAELACILLVHLKRWPSSRPTYHLSYNLFWADNNPVFGTWHRPNGHFLHQIGCFNTEYTTNSYGARDIERTLHSSTPRTIVLGDSFMEGLGLPDKDRLSNILERDTGREHLNFGSGGDFSPLQYALVYKSLASKFDHNEVLVGILPANDFFEMDPDWGKIYEKGRYRPYYAPDFSVVYQGTFDPNAGEGAWDHLEAFFRAYLASYHVGQYVNSLRYWRTRGRYTGYYDYSDADLARLKHALEDIKQTADSHNAKLAVFLIPRANDFNRLHETGTDRLGPVMEQWGREAGIPIKDLMPDMEARSKGNYRPYFFACDGHWSPYGAATAADILEHWLGEKQ